jgi:hypothetical protein
LVLAAAALDEVPAPQLLDTYLSWVQDVKQAVDSLRGSIRAVRAHRERCCQVLGSALGTALALEQAIYSGNLDSHKGRKLRELCADVIATLELAESRVQVSSHFAQRCAEAGVTFAQMRTGKRAKSEDIRTQSTGTMRQGHHASLAYHVGLACQ